MTTTDETAPAADDEEPADPPRPFWHLKEDDQRLLFITIVGGLVANVGLVLVVGLGLLMAHRVERTIDALKLIGLASLVAGILILLRWAAPRVVFALSGRIVASFFWVFGPPHMTHTMAAALGLALLRILTVLTVLASLAVAVLILALVGLSAGIK